MRLLRLTLTNIENTWNRVCETLSIALYAATLHDLMFPGGSSVSIPLKMFVGGMFTSIVRTTVQVSLFNKLIRAGAITRLDYLCLSNLQSMGENLDTSVVLHRFYLQLWN